VGTIARGKPLNAWHSIKLHATISRGRMKPIVKELACFQISKYL
jgi:hypothetical protein